MGPELLDPQRFGLETSCPTKSSDCYALGMVIYETISGHMPFHEHADLIVFLRVLEGKHPSRKVGFVGGLWETLELCWEPQPSARPSIEEVLRRLEEILNSSGSSSPGADEETEEEDDDDWDSANDSSGKFPRLIPPAKFHGLSVMWIQGRRHQLNLKEIHTVLDLRATPTSVIRRSWRTQWRWGTSPPLESHLVSITKPRKYSDRSKTGHTGGLLLARLSYPHLNNFRIAERIQRYPKHILNQRDDWSRCCTPLQATLRVSCFVLNRRRVTSKCELLSDMA